MVLNFGESESLGTGIMISTLFAVDPDNGLYFDENSRNLKFLVEPKKLFDHRVEAAVYT